MFSFSKFNRNHYYVVAAIGTVLVMGILAITNSSKQSGARGPGTADKFAILAGETITSTGATTVSGQIGLYPGTSITQTPDIVLNGSIHLAKGAARNAKDALVTSYNEAEAAATTEVISADLGGRTLVAGVYTASSSMGLTGTLTLDAQGDPDATWIFQAGSTLTTASSSSVVIINGGTNCNVFWQVGSSATLGSGSTLVGTVMALTSISANDGATIEGRLLARNGSVTLIANTISRPICAAATATPTPTPTDTATPTPTESGGVTPLATATPTPSSSPSASKTPTPTPSPQVSDKPTGSVGAGG